MKNRTEFIYNCETGFINNWTAEEYIANWTRYHQQKFDNSRREHIVEYHRINELAIRLSNYKLMLTKDWEVRKYEGAYKQPKRVARLLKLISPIDISDADKFLK